MSESAPFVNVPASRDRAEFENRSGAWSKNRMKIVDLVKSSRARGMTWRDVARFCPDLHHGQISGILSKLHQEGIIFSIRYKREGCHPYIDSSWRDEFGSFDRFDHPVKTKAKVNAEIAEMVRRMFDENPTLGRRGMGFFSMTAREWLALNDLRAMVIDTIDSDVLDQ